MSCLLVWLFARAPNEWMWKEVMIEPDVDGGTVIGDITLIAVLHRVISWRMPILSRSFMQPTCFAQRYSGGVRCYRICTTCDRQGRVQEAIRYGTGRISS